jgi:hypothetical protein
MWLRALRGRRVQTLQRFYVLCQNVLMFAVVIVNAMVSNSFCVDNKMNQMLKQINHHGAPATGTDHCIKITTANISKMFWLKVWAWG